MRHLYRLAKSFLSLACLVLLVSGGDVFAQTTTFTYHGQLTGENLVTDGTYDMQFTLFDSAVEGTQVGPTLTFAGKKAAVVTSGHFEVRLNFGADAFTGEDRFLEVSIRFDDSKFIPVGPRQHLTSSPYSIRSLNAAVADISTNATQLEGLSASQFVQTGDSRLSDSRMPMAGSSNYIQNTTAEQGSTNFNISGNGTAGGTLSGNTVNAITRYSLGGLHILSAAGTNVFVGSNAGNSISSGAHNSFFGTNAGRMNSTGHSNSFFGSTAGYDNINGVGNAFFGSSAGQQNISGNSNSFFGQTAGLRALTGSENSFFGNYAGYFNFTGSGNSFFGTRAGWDNETGTNNTIIGSNADVGSTNLNYATAIGAGSTVSFSNSVVLGRTNDTVRIPGNLVLNGSITFVTLGAAGSTTLCRNTSWEIANCSSSLRYKTNITPFSFGMNLVSRLRPISFDWKADGSHDVGFGAEEVAAINPLFVTFNSKGEVEGVKYDRLSVAFVNAFKEQQTQIAQQQDLIKKQQVQIDALRKLVCLDHRNADVCR